MSQGPPDLCGRAFGLRLRARFPFPGLPADRAGGGPAVELHLASRGDVVRGYPADAEALWEVRRPDGRAAVRFLAHPDAGHLLVAQGWGAYHVDAAATRVRCAPVRASTWRWQRYLVGQVLPYVSVLHELEVFHASVVSVDGAGIAFLAASTGGKSTLAAALLCRGAGFVADDVLTVRVPDQDDARVLAEPGVGLASVRHDAVARLGTEHVVALGPAIGADDDAVRIAVEPVPAAVPVVAAYFLERDPASRALAIRPGDDPRLLLASSFNFVIRDPRRLVRHLDVCARLSRTASVSVVAIPPDVGPYEVADAVARHAVA